MRVEKGKDVQLPPDSGEPIKAWLKEGGNTYMLIKSSTIEVFLTLSAKNKIEGVPAYWTYDRKGHEVWLWPVPREDMEIFFDCDPRKA